MFKPAGGKPRQRFALFCKHALSARYVTAWVLGWVGWGGDVDVHVNLRHTHATSRLGLGGVGGDVDVHVNLRHTRMLRHVLGWVGCLGDVNVHVNLRHTRMLRHVLGWVGWWGMLTFM